MPNSSGLNVKAYLGSRGRVTSEAECPGVRAHPATMIGGANLDTKMMIDLRVKLRNAFARGQVHLRSHDRTGRPIDFDYWYLYNHTDGLKFDDE